MRHFFKELFIPRSIGQARRISENQQGFWKNNFKKQRLFRNLNYLFALT